jgi:hypothetical protein
MSDSNAPIEEHARMVRERWYHFMQGEFDARSLPPHTPRAEDRMVAAMEFAAYQLGEINQRLAYLVNLTQELRNDGR